MKRSMLEILACPLDKSHPLELYEAKAGGDDIAQGVLSCPSCSRFYPIIDGIPVMLPDDLRDRDAELEFLRRHKDVLPDKITGKAAPWHL